ncbi:MAG: pilus assembly protein PilM [Phycisphaerales bacterium]|nr:pilus assembly protein PilM [Phycisphaerales bacterium]
MASTTAVWGIDVGQCALKAVKLRPGVEGQVELVAFDLIEHPKILSQPDADRDELIAQSLKKFAERNPIQGDRFVIGVPGQQTFARFCKMPPLDLKKDAKKIPELVMYEATQQIPFDINDVVWDYQVFTTEGNPDIEVGIFAIRKDLIRKHLGFFSAVGIAPTAVQAIPAALYNFAKFDVLQPDAGGAIVLVDVGAQNTDLIIVEPNSAWTRNIPIGGNSFTEALVRQFKVSFGKAEQLKRTAATHQYARQIFQAMRPVFAELVAEIQRSLGFYSSTHREVELRTVLALGSAFHLPGLQKYLENNLQLAGGVQKLEKFNKLAASEASEKPLFKDNLLTFGAAYGLALQGLGLSRISASLLPPDLARIAVWRKKRPFFVATAASLLLAAGVPYIASSMAMQRLTSESSQSDRQKTMTVINQARDLQKRFREVATDTTAKQRDIETLLDLQRDKAVIARLVTLVHAAIPRPKPDELANVDSAAALRKLIESDPKRFPRTERGEFRIESLRIEYVPDVTSVNLAGGSGPGPGGVTDPVDPSRPAPPPRPQVGGAAPGAARTDGFIVRIQGRLLAGRNRAEAAQWLSTELLSRLRELSRLPGNGFHIPDDDPKDRTKRSISDPITRAYYGDASGGGPTPPPGPPPLPDPSGSGFGQPRPPVSTTIDPVTGEDARTDWSVSFAFRVQMGDAPPPPAEAAPAGGAAAPSGRP